MFGLYHLLNTEHFNIDLDLLHWSFPFSLCIWGRVGIWFEIGPIVFYINL